MAGYFNEPLTRLFLHFGTLRAFTQPESREIYLIVQKIIGRKNGALSISKNAFGFEQKVESLSHLLNFEGN